MNVNIKFLELELKDHQIQSFSQVSKSPKRLRDSSKAMEQISVSTRQKDNGIKERTVAGSRRCYGLLLNGIFRTCRLSPTLQM